MATKKTEDTAPKKATPSAKRTSTTKEKSETKQNISTHSKAQSSQTASPQTPPRLHRSTHDVVLAGVAGGLGEYFTIDPVIFRIIFVVLALVQGMGVFLYAILWLIIPTREHQGLTPEETIKSNSEEIKSKVNQLSQEVSANANKTGSKANWWAILLIGVGILFLLNTLDILRFRDMSDFWPLLLVGLGVFLLVRK